MELGVGEGRTVQSDLTSVGGIDLQRTKDRKISWRSKKQIMRDFFREVLVELERGEQI